MKNSFFIGLNTKNIVLACYFILSVSCNNKKFVGVVTSATPEASKVGEEIFLKGGNAIDVAVAVSFALGVTEPAMSGLGGGTQVLLSIKNLPPISINGTTLSPNNTPLHIKDTLTYHRRSTIPSTVKVLDYVWRAYGSGKISWEELLSPAIELAEQGFAVGPFRAKVYKQYKNKLLQSNFNTSLVLYKEKSIPKTGDIIKQRQLANTLKRLAKYGADDFYNGEIAKEIAKDMKANGGWITLEDLQSFQAPKEVTPLSINYEGLIVYSQPPPCGGWTTLLALNLIKKIKGDQISNEDIIMALYLAHKDRENHPITDLMDYDSTAQIKLSNEYAKQLLLENTFFNKRQKVKESGETTHFSVVDSQGNAIAVTASINAYFGALSASSELGFLYNTYMDDFIFENPDHPFAIRPNAMAYSSMSPTIVQKNKKNIFIIGSPGSSRIISSVAQITAKWIDNNNINYLIKEPRVHVSKEDIYFENKTDTTIIYKYFLKEDGFRYKLPKENLMLREGLNPYFGGIHAIANEKDKWVGVADPRRDGKAIVVTKE